MTIDSIRPTGSISPVERPQGNSPSSRVERSREGDSVDISLEGMEKAELLRAFEIVAAVPAPEVRADRVAEIKAKINDPSYITDAVLGAAADDILNILI